MTFVTNPTPITAQKMKFSIKNFFSKCDQICSFLRIWSHLLKKSLMENFIFCAVNVKVASVVPPQCQNMATTATYFGV